MNERIRRFTRPAGGPRRSEATGLFRSARIFFLGGLPEIQWPMETKVLDDLERFRLRSSDAGPEIWKIYFIWECRGFLGTKAEEEWLSGRFFPGKVVIPQWEGELVVFPAE